MDMDPRITYYARVINNINGQELVGFTDAAKNNTWYYGSCNGLEGGESEYIVEFDIWNNEPAFEANTREVIVPNVTNCKFTVWPDENCIPTFDQLFNLTNNTQQYIPFMYAKCDTFGYRSDFTGIRYNTMLEGITGNVNPNLIGTLQGCGDHARIQTKIILPQASQLENARYAFVFAFYYDYE